MEKERGTIFGSPFLVFAAVGGNGTTTTRILRGESRHTLNNPMSCKTPFHQRKT